MVSKVKDTWEKIYKSESWGQYPEIPFVCFLAKNYYKFQDRKNVKFLELGCGTGAQTRVLYEQGFSNFIALDISEDAIGQCLHRIPTGDFRCQDIRDLSNFGDESFDCVFEVSVLQYNKYSEIQKICKEIYRLLKPNGKFFGLMIADSLRLDSGYRGNTHFYTRNELVELFKDFEEINIGSITVKQSPISNKFWIVEVTK